MNSWWVMLGAALFPFAAMGLLFWLTRLEETLPRDVRAAQRRPEPPPILQVEARPTSPAVTAVRIPAPRAPADLSPARRPPAV